jgi:hypothetical protein
MPTNLTGATIASTYDQLLHVDDGPTATEKTVYSGTGVATAMKVGTTSASVGNVQLTGNTVQATTGNLTLGSDIAFGSAGNARTALGLGSMATQNSGAVAITGGTISGVTFTGSFTGLTLIESTTLATSAAAAGVNLNGNTLAADGTDTNIDINITPKGTGEVNITKVDIDGGAIDGTTVGATTAASVKGTTVEATTSIGYPTGTGGTVTQGTSRTTGVTLDKITGEIVLFAGSLGGHDAEEFTLTNSFIAANDVVMLCIKSGAAAATRKYYQVHAVAVAAGSCVISVGNIDNATIPSAGTESPVIQFLILKGAVA